MAAKAAANAPTPRPPARNKLTRRKPLVKETKTTTPCSATQTASGRLRRKRTKTFTGCWTCRARKVKCDEARPHCMACRKSDLSCEGYSIRLLWLSDGYQANELSKRRSSLSDKERWLMTLDLYQHDSNLDDYLDQIDETFPYVETVTLGPFSVFNSGMCEQIKPENIDVDICASPLNLMSTISESGQLGSFEDPPSLVPSWISSRPPIKSQDSFLSVASSNSSSGSSESSPTSFEDNTPIFSTDSKLTELLPDICTEQHDENQLSMPVFQEDLSVELSEMSDLWSPRFTWIADVESDGLSTTLLQKDIGRIILDNPSNEIVRLSNSLPQFSPSSDMGYLSMWEVVDIQTADIQDLRNVIFGKVTSSCISFGNIPLSTVCISSSVNNNLMQFYSSEIVKRMQPINHQKNPWRALYLPKAIQGVGEVASFGTCSDSRASLFFSLMAVAAYTLSMRPSSGKEESLYHCKIGHIYKAISLKLIRHTLKTDFFCAKYKETLMALLSTVTVAVFSGSMDGIGEYLTMCEQFIKTRGTNKKRSSKANVLHQIFYALRLIHVSTAIIPMPFSENYYEQELTKEDLREAGEEGESAVWTSNNTFEVCYCITPSLLDMIVDTVQLAGHLKYYAGKTDLTVSSLLTQRSEKLESRLKNWSLHIDETYTVIMADPGSKEIFSLHARAFHQSLCIYFARIIKGTHPQLLQKEVEKTIVLLEKMASIKGESTPVLWCAFISGSEALDSELQARFISYIDKIANYSPGSIHTLREMLQEIWERRKHTQDFEYSWEALLKEKYRGVLFS